VVGIPVKRALRFFAAPFFLRKMRVLSGFDFAAAGPVLRERAGVAMVFYS